MDEMREIAETAANVIRKQAMRSPEAKQRILAQMDIRLALCSMKDHDGCGCKLTRTLLDELRK